MSSNVLAVATLSKSVLSRERLRIEVILLATDRERNQIEGVATPPVLLAFHHVFHRAFRLVFHQLGIQRLCHFFSLLFQGNRSIGKSKK